MKKFLVLLVLSVTIQTVAISACVTVHPSGTYTVDKNGSRKK